MWIQPSFKRILLNTGREGSAPGTGGAGGGGVGAAAETESLNVKVGFA